MSRPTKIISHPSIYPPHRVISTVSMKQTITTTTNTQHRSTHARLLWDHRTLPLFTLAIPTTLTFTQSQTVCPAECVCGHPPSRQMNSENYITSILIRPQRTVKPLHLLLGCMLFLTCQSYKSNLVLGVIKVLLTGFKTNAALQKRRKKTKLSQYLQLLSKPTIPMKLGTTLLFPLLPTTIHL